MAPFIFHILQQQQLILSTLKYKYRYEFKLKYKYTYKNKYMQASGNYKQTADSAPTEVSSNNCLFCQR